MTKRVFFALIFLLMAVRCLDGQIPLTNSPTLVQIGRTSTGMMTLKEVALSSGVTITTNPNGSLTAVQTPASPSTSVNPTQAAWITLTPSTVGGSSGSGPTVWCSGSFPSTQYWPAMAKETRLAAPAPVGGLSSPTFTYEALALIQPVGAPTSTPGVTINIPPIYSFALAACPGSNPIPGTTPGTVGSQGGPGVTFAANSLQTGAIVETRTNVQLLVVF